MWVLLADFLENQEVVTRQNGYHGTQLRETFSMTQGGVAFPTLFDMALGSVVFHWLSLTTEDKATIQDVLVHMVVWSLVVFYKYYGILVSPDLEWL